MTGKKSRAMSGAAAGRSGERMSHEKTGRTASGVGVAVLLPPLVALNGENSRAKVQNVRGDSSAKYLDGLHRAFDTSALRFAEGTADLADRRAFTRVLGRLRAVDWVVYAKRPFAGPAQVLDYLGRYRPL